MAKAWKTKYYNYPLPLQGPDVPYKNERKPAMAVRGIWLHLSAFLMENLGSVTTKVWHDTGFGSLRKIRHDIEDTEPCFLPEVVPRDDHRDGEGNKAVQETKQTARAKGLHAIRYPEARYYSAADYHRMYRSGELDPVKVVEVLLPMIRRNKEPKGRHHLAWFDVQEDLVRGAAKASALRYRNKQPLGPLDGVPIAVKDEYDVIGYRTSLGSRNDYTGPVLEEGSNEAWPVRKLKEAGAIILGKTSMHEFGLDTPGNNPVYGTPRNPYHPNYYTGGSSSGSGYAVSAGLVPIALGSDGGGSIRIPASLCGVFGLKPSHNRVSCKPSQNHSVTCAVLGPLAADTESLAIAFSVIAAPHPTSSFPPLAPLDLRLPAPEIRPRRLGIVHGWWNRATPGTRYLCDKLISALQSEHGYEIIDITIPFLPQGQVAHAMTVLTDAATLLPDTSNLTPANRILLALGRTTPATDYLLAQKLRGVLMRHLAWLFGEMYPGMLIVTPAMTCEGIPIRGGEEELKRGVSDGAKTMETMEYMWLGNFCGLPSLVSPAGLVWPEGHPHAGRMVEEGEDEDGEGTVPVGLMATGAWCEEEALLQFGALVERIGWEMRRRKRPPVWEDVIGKAME